MAFAVRGGSTVGGDRSSAVIWAAILTPCKGASEAVNSDEAGTTGSWSRWSSRRSRSDGMIGKFG